MIKLGIVGYGNLGRSLEKLAQKRSDVQLIGIFTRRNPQELRSPFGTPFYSQNKIFDFENKTDVLALCTGSANDLTSLSLALNKSFNTVDSYDNHSQMKDYVASLDRVAKDNGRFSIVGAGWDPGVLSIMRGLFEGLTDCRVHTFWGKGVSQGHSEAIRRIDGVLEAVQYTVPKDGAMNSVKNGFGDSLSSCDKHVRECYVVIEDGADKLYIENAIKNMPNYFLGYETTVYFIDREEFQRNHRKMYHGGAVLCSGEINGARTNMEFSLKLDSNPDFTATVLLSYAICVHRLYRLGERGVKTVLDLPMTALFDGDRLDIVENYL